MLRIGLTGGICCGKSTALDIFGELGFDAINLDRYVHEALQGNRRLQGNIVQKFGKECLDFSTGRILPDRLAEIAFQDVDRLRDLEAMIYPEIQNLWQRQNQKPTVIEIPLLYEKRLESWFDIILCVYASYPTQLQRAMESRRWTREQFDLRASHQMVLSEKMQRADFVLGNNGVLPQLRRQIEIFVIKMEDFVKERFF